MTNNRFQYALRRSLPPWSFEQNLRELEGVLKKWQLDEVIVKVDAEDLSHGQVPLSWLEKYLPYLAELKAMLESHHVLFSINPWITLCHLDRGRRGGDAFSCFEGMVDISGAGSTACSCPLSPAWLAHSKTIWRKYASLHPHSIWIEDDLRNYSHSPNVKFGCFCHRHLERFSKLAELQRTVMREELAEALSAPGKPHPWRRIWLDMLGDITAEVTEELSRAVHEVDTSIQMGLMTSGPRSHVIEGRNWEKQIRMLTDNGKTPFRSRPPLGDYCEALPVSLYSAADLILHTRAVMKVPAEELTEVEDFPYSRQTCSVSLTQARMLVSAMFGAHGAAINLFDHLGTPMLVEPEYGKMLSRSKPVLNAICREMKQPGRYRGAKVLFSNDFAKSCESAVRLEPCPGWYSDGSACFRLLNELGIPAVYSGDERLAVLTGQTARALSHDEIMHWLSRSLWLDGAAASILMSSGYAPLIGLKDMSDAKHPEEYPCSSVEEFLPRQQNAPPCVSSCFIPAYGPNLALRLLTPDGHATAASQLLNNQGRVMGILSLCTTNSLGGRIFVHGMDYDPYAANCNFLAPMRKVFLQRVLKFLLPEDNRPLAFSGDGVHPLGFRRDFEDGGVFLGFMNLSGDPWNDVQFQGEDLERFSSWELLKNGKWLALPAKCISGNCIRIRKKMASMEGVFLRAY